MSPDNPLNSLGGSADPEPEDALVNTKAPEKVQQMFGDIAGTYDFLNHALSMNIDKRWRRFTARQVVSAGSRRILDVCGGTGDLALALRQQALRIKASPMIVCSDFTPEMMHIGARKFARVDTGDPDMNASLRPVPLIADTTCLPFADDQFDAVTVAFGIRNVVDTSAGLREMARVCRPGGVVAVLEFSETRHPLINSGFRFYFRRLLPLIGRVVTGTRAYSYLSKSVQKFPEGQEFAELLSAETGSPTVMHRLSLGIATLYVSQKTARAGG